MKPWHIIVLAITAVALLGIHGSKSLASSPAEPTAANLPVYSADGALIPNPHIVTGSVEVSGFTVVTLSGRAAFTTVNSYTCVLSTTHPGPLETAVIKIDASHFKLPGPADRRFVYAYQCIGN